MEYVWCVSNSKNGIQEKFENAFTFIYSACARVSVTFDALQFIFIIWSLNFRR